MARDTILGIPIEVSDDIKQPLGAVVIIKALDGEDDVCHWIHKTDDITRVEAVGMCTAAGDEYRAALLGLSRSE